MFSASEIIPTTKDSTKTTTRIPASIQGQVTAVDEKRSLNTVSEAIMMTTTDAKKLAMATSTLINNARYVILSERVNCSVCPALESTSMVRSSSFGESATAMAPKTKTRTKNAKLTPL